MSKETGGPASRRKIDFSIETVDGNVALVSACDYARLQGMNWRVGKNGYVYLVGGRRRGMACLMHRIVMGARPGEEVHHGEGGKLDNTRENLELTTPSDHQKHHKDALIARNKASRVYAESANCAFCGSVFTKNPSHRGRQLCCSLLCGVRHGTKKRRGPRNEKQL